VVSVFTLFFFQNGGIWTRISLAELDFLGDWISEQIRNFEEPWKASLIHFVHFDPFRPQTRCLDQI
jgi:hypothetical protein